MSDYEPNRVRLTGLREEQLADLVQIDDLCSRMYAAFGFDAAEVPTRREADFVRLARENKFLVAEAEIDGERVNVGFLAWHDESPGVAYLADLQVHPDHHRYGYATQLITQMRDEARGMGFEQIVVRCWEKAAWAMGFYRRQRFMPIDATAPAKVQGWKEERIATGKPLTRPGEVALWSPIGAAPKVVVDDEMDMTLLTGEIPSDD
jgi:amino-acid N-acetyltransferase